MVIDLEGGHTLTPVCDSEDRLTGYIHAHQDPVARRPCQALYGVVAGITGAVYQVISKNPLTLVPAVKCPACGIYGYVRDGKWIPITTG